MRTRSELRARIGDYSTTEVERILGSAQAIVSRWNMRAALEPDQEKHEDQKQDSDLSQDQEDDSPEQVAQDAL